MRRRSELSADGYGLLLEDIPRPATSESLFGDDQPLELEIGCGKGTFLVSESSLRPDVNFLGLEYARRYWRYAADRLRRHTRDNARVVLADASTFARDFLPDESLAAVHIYFPDPWPKKRHQRRRFVQAPLIELLARKMRSGARLQVVTDHAGYFAQIQAVLGRSPLEPAHFGASSAASDDEIVGSNFERKYRLEGRTLNAIAVVKP